MLAPLSDAHRAAIGLAVGAPGSVDAATLANAALPVSTAADPDSFLVTLDRSIAPATYPALAARTCGARARDRVHGVDRCERDPGQTAAQPAAGGDDRSEEHTLNSSH